MTYLTCRELPKSWQYVWLRASSRKIWGFVSFPLAIILKVLFLLNIEWGQFVLLFLFAFYCFICFLSCYFKICQQFRGSVYLFVYHSFIYFFYMFVYFYLFVQLFIYVLIVLAFSSSTIYVMSRSQPAFQAMAPFGGYDLLTVTTRRFFTKIISVMHYFLIN